MWCTFILRTSESEVTFGRHIILVLGSPLRNGLKEPRRSNTGANNRNAATGRIPQRDRAMGSMESRAFAALTSSTLWNRRWELTVLLVVRCNGPGCSPPGCAEAIVGGGSMLPYGATFLRLRSSLAFSYSLAVQAPPGPPPLH